MGATKIFGTGRNQALLDKVRALAPGRIDVLAVSPTPPSPASGGGKGRGCPARPFGRLGESGDRRSWRRRHDRLPAARRARKCDDACALLPPPRWPRGQCRRGDGGAAAQCLLADDQPHRPARLGVVHHRRRRGDGGDGRRRHARFVGSRTPRIAAVQSQRRCCPAWTIATAASPISSSIRHGCRVGIARLGAAGVGKIANAMPTPLREQTRFAHPTQRLRTC